MAGETRAVVGPIKFEDFLDGAGCTRPTRLSDSFFFWITFSTDIKAAKNVIKFTFPI